MESTVSAELGATEPGHLAGRAPAEGGSPYATYPFAYRGTGAGLFFVVFKNILLTLITLGIYLPWARAERRRYLFQNIEIDGHRLRFHGTGREMFFGYLKVGVAYAIFFLLPALVSRWNPAIGAVLQIALVLVLVPLVPFAIYGARRYLLSRTSLRGIRFGMDPGAGGFARVFLVGYLLTLVTIGIYGPIWQNEMHAYLIRRTRYGSQAFAYDGPNNEALVIGIRGFFLTLLTLGIYLPWYAAEIARFRVTHTTFQGARGNLTLSGGDLFLIYLLSFFGILLTLGLAFPWITTFALATVLGQTTFYGVIDYASVERRAAAGNAAAEGFADVLDVGLEV